MKWNKTTTVVLFGIALILVLGATQEWRREASGGPMVDLSGCTGEPAVPNCSAPSGKDLLAESREVSVKGS